MSSTERPDFQETQAYLGHDPEISYGSASPPHLPIYNPPGFFSTFAIDIPESPLDSPSDEQLQSRERIDVIQGWEHALLAQSPSHNPPATAFAMALPESPLDSPSDENLQSREGINVIDGAPLSTTEAAGRDIVDVLLEQWTVPIDAWFGVKSAASS